jgi:hypothetical protein
MGMPALHIQASGPCERPVLSVNGEDSHVPLCRRPSLRKSINPSCHISSTFIFSSLTLLVFGSRSAHTPRRYGKTLNSCCTLTSRVACRCTIRLFRHPISSLAYQNQGHEIQTRHVPSLASLSQTAPAQALTAPLRHHPNPPTLRQPNPQLRHYLQHLPLWGGPFLPIRPLAPRPDPLFPLWRASTMH